VAGISQLIPRYTVGAALGDAMLAAEAIEMESAAAWNPVDRIIHPRPELAGMYEELFGLYLQAYLDSRAVTHALAGRSA
jgi:xylulokinase